MYDISIIYKLQEMTFTQGCSGIEDFPVHLHQLISNFTIFLIFKNILDLITERNRWVSKSVDLVDQFGLEI